MSKRIITNFCLIFMTCTYPLFNYCQEVYSYKDFINDYVPLFYETEACNKHTTKYSSPPKSIYEVENIDSLYKLAELPFSSHWYPREAFIIQNHIILFIWTEYIENFTLYHDGQVFIFSPEGNILFNKMLGHLDSEHDERLYMEADTLGSTFNLCDTILKWVMQISSPQSGYTEIDYVIKEYRLVNLQKMELITDTTYFIKNTLYW